MISELGQFFIDNPLLDITFKTIELDETKAKSAHSPAVLESLALKAFKVNPGDFIFIEWIKLTDEVLVNSDRTAFISSTASANKIQQVLRSWMLQEYKINSILGSTTTITDRKIRHNIPPPQPNYDVVLSVLNPNPDLQKLNWNVRLAAEKYIAPFLDSFSPISNFTIKSQWKYQVKFDQVDKQIQDDSKLKRHFMLSQDHLPQLITSLEKRLGNQVSNNPCIHLVFYVPPCKKAPIHIYTKQGVRASTNGVESFISAKWGGIIILNPPESVCQKYLETEAPSEIDINSHDAMEIALYLLRKILDMESNVSDSGFFV